MQRYIYLERESDSEHSHHLNKYYPRLDKLLKSQQQMGQQVYSRRDRLIPGVWVGLVLSTKATSPPLYRAGGLPLHALDERSGGGQSPPDMLPPTPLQEGVGDWREGRAGMAPLLLLLAGLLCLLQPLPPSSSSSISHVLGGGRMS